jgi:hypothetical protein
MKTLPHFAWTKHPTQTDMLCCLWMDLSLHVWKSGEWKVMGDIGHDMHGVLVSHSVQTTGKNLKDAQQRAQAAAMVQLQLRDQQPKT